ncbi:Hsp33 family molecular chaperone HslO [Pseudomonas typographi]|uniref:33 kDa chaperonin n=1 Tax=Pseudomonas typographi TaxID=2715964 RepID=A0ABR7Z3P8_9PSED|nr:Hsp33 family molecular chaperone HslO [Pseudomonas typographi]MBD1550125.1 Hsp33 family molecular chaperone HslO [Pseudomonas typographi]MBD1586115.1 Hsp33 family molecular chaperone HslO [Pseudomonas typographi]MBD1599973.1 Hsp33 family molecular chaperone HslO [Pseudomonas typographi]
MSHSLPSDFSQRFIFDNADVRGELVELAGSYAEVLARHPYPEPVARLLGEFMAAAALLVGTLKFDGLLVLQARSDGPIPLLMIECSSEREIRGLARYNGEQLAGATQLGELMPGGTLAMTIDPRRGKRYQGIVELDGQTLAECFDNYFSQSEQLGTRFWLQADGEQARGLLLQQLPAEQQRDDDERANHWQHVLALAETLTGAELLGLDNETLLHRLYHEEAVRLFEEQPLHFQCSCSRERSARALASLGEEDALRLVEEQGGQVEIDCQFCNERYLYDQNDVAQLFAGGGVEAPSETRH